MLFVLQLNNKCEMAKIKLKLNPNIRYNHASWVLEVQDYQIEYGLRVIIDKYLRHEEIDAKDKKLIMQYLVYQNNSDNIFKHAFNFNDKEHNLLRNIIMSVGLNPLTKEEKHLYAFNNDKCIEKIKNELPKLEGIGKERKTSELTVRLVISHYLNDEVITPLDEVSLLSNFKNDCKSLALSNNNYKELVYLNPDEICIIKMITLAIISRDKDDIIKKQMVKKKN
ncbi:MAG: hypothetical protein RR406_05455 [Bacilli bacterium]